MEIPIDITVDGCFDEESNATFGVPIEDVIAGLNSEGFTVNVENRVDCSNESFPEDQDGNGCDDYWLVQDECGMFDTEEFVAATCCACIQGDAF